MSEVGEYVLKLFCDYPDPACPQVGWVTFTGTDLADARKQAREKGWWMPLNIQTGGSYGSPVWACPSCKEPE